MRRAMRVDLLHTLWPNPKLKAHLDRVCSPMAAYLGGHHVHVSGIEWALMLVTILAADHLPETNRQGVYVHVN
jgi:hypothetical protein